MAIVVTANTGVSDLRPGPLAGAAGRAGDRAADVLDYRLIADVGPTRASLVTYLVPRCRRRRATRSSYR